MIKILRKVDRFTSTIYRVLTCSDAIKTYVALWRILVLVCMFTVWLGMAARDLWEEFVQPNIDEFVESCLEEGSEECQITTVHTVISRLLEFVRSQEGIGNLASTIARSIVKRLSVLRKRLEIGLKNGLTQIIG